MRRVAAYRLVALEDIAVLHVSERTDGQRTLAYHALAPLDEARAQTAHSSTLGQGLFEEGIFLAELLFHSFCKL